MTIPPLLSDLRVLVKDQDRYYTYAKVDVLDGGNGLMLYDYYTGEKVSRHSDGRVWSRKGGGGSQTAPTTAIPFSDIEREAVRAVAIPSDATRELPLYKGDPANAFIFSSTVLSSHGRFAAEVVADAILEPTLSAWRQHPDYLSAQTWQRTGTGKTVILTVLNQRSTGSW